MKPDRSDFTDAEWRIIQRYRTPRAVQGFLRTLSYNHDDSQRSFREVLKHKRAHCLEAALTAAAILEQHGYPPIVLSFESIDTLDHVIYIYQHDGLWGAIARSRDAGLDGRKPVFRRPRDLLLSYVDPYVDFTGRITGYAVVDLEQMERKINWRFSSRNLWALEKYLIDLPHREVRTSDRRYAMLLNRYKEFRAQFPKKQATYYDNKHLWL